MMPPKVRLTSLSRFRAGAPARALLKALLMGAAITGGTAVATTTLVGCTDEKDPQTHVDRLKDPVKRPLAVDRLIKFVSDAQQNQKTAKSTLASEGKLAAVDAEEKAELEKAASGEKLKALFDVIITPLTELANSGELDERKHAELLMMLAKTRDERAMPALVKALDNYKPDDRTPEDLDNAIVEIVINMGQMALEGTLKDAGANKGLFGLFKNLEAYTPKGQNKGLFRILNHTLLTIADPAWESDLIGMIKVPIKSTKKKAQKQVLTQVYWQITATELLGKLKAKAAVVPLLQIVLTPFKAPLASTAINAMIKIGKPAIDECVKLLNGDNEKLAEYAATEFKRSKEDQDVKVTKAIEKEADMQYKLQSVIILGFMGTKDVVAPMIGIIDSGDKSMKGFVASELAKLPKDDAVTDKFKEVFDEMTLSTKTPRGDYAKENLAGGVEAYYDVALAKWLAEKVSEDIKGDKADVDAFRESALPTLIKAADADLWPTVEKLFGQLPELKGNKKEKYFIRSPEDKDKKKGKGPFTEQEIVDQIVALKFESGDFRDEAEGARWTPITNSQTFGAALGRAAYVKAMTNSKKVLDECGTKVDCYVAKISSPEGQNPKTDIIGLKSVYMAAALGGEAVKPKLVALLDQVKNRGLRSQLALAIDRLSPNGDAEAVKKMQGMIDEAEATRIQTKIDEVKSLKQFIYRLEARQGK